MDKHEATTLSLFQSLEFFSFKVKKEKVNSSINNKEITQNLNMHPFLFQNKMLAFPSAFLLIV